MKLQNEPYIYLEVQTVLQNESEINLLELSDRSRVGEVVRKLSPAAPRLPLPLAAAALTAVAEAVATRINMATTSWLPCTPWYQFSPPPPTDQTDNGKVLVHMTVWNEPAAVSCSH
jgi:hypothetical protein